MKEFTITEAHLDAALAKPWGPCSCLLAQAFSGGKYHCSTEKATATDGRRYSFSRAVRDLQVQFDALHGGTIGEKEKARRVKELRALLPFTFQAFTNLPFTFQAYTDDI